VRPCQSVRVVPMRRCGLPDRVYSGHCQLAVLD
jgi:hypothetical protein